VGNSGQLIRESPKGGGRRVRVRARCGEALHGPWGTRRRIAAPAPEVPLTRENPPSFGGVGVVLWENAIDG